MPTFYDPIELEDIDIDDATAKFYLIKLPNEAGFKFCATTQNLDSPQMKYDPITRIKEYWPITREQLTQGDFTLLFPDGTIRTEPFKNADDLNRAFHFDPPFDPNSQTSRFGQRAQVASGDNLTDQLQGRTGRNAPAINPNQTQRLLDSYLRYVAEYNQTHHTIQNDFFTGMETNPQFEWFQMQIGTPQRQSRMSPQEQALSDSIFSRNRQRPAIPDWLIDRYSEGLSTQIRTDVYRSTGRVGEMFSNNRLTPAEIADLTQIQQVRIADFIRRDDVPTHIAQELADQATQTRTTNQSLGPVESRFPHDLPQEPADLMQQATNSGLGERQLATIGYHTLRINTCVNAINEGLVSFHDFLNMDQQIIYGVSCLILNKPAVIAALRDHTITMQDFDSLNIDQISRLGRIALTHQSCITAIADGRTTIAQLADLGVGELERAVETDTYPQSGMQLR